MARFSLCSPCASRFGGYGGIGVAANGGGCHICRGALRGLDALVDGAVEQARLFEWGTFSVASSFPSEVFVREEEVAAFAAPGRFTSLKNYVNSALVEKIASATGKETARRYADAAFEFDFVSGKAFVRPSAVYVYGHYLKLSRKHCQSRWHCSECGGAGCAACKGSGQNYPSVEDEIGKVLLAAFAGKECVLHASGREDVDVRSLGNGRPFVMEIKAPKKRGADLRALEKKLSENPDVKAVGLRLVRQNFVDAVCNSHFDKEYSALISADRPLSEKDARLLEGLTGAFLFQQTPNRVLARRADLERKRRVYAVSAKEEPGGRLRLRIFAEAGTYIKELIHSDGGRTRPSVSEMLGCKAVCEELDVIGIRDYFLETIE